MISGAVQLEDMRGAALAAFRSGRAKSAAIVAVAASISAVLFLFDPSKSNMYPLCPLNALTGLYCPGCGTLRASHQLLHLHIAAALGLNPLAVLSMPFLGYALLSRVLIGIRGRPLPSIFVPAKWIWALLGVIIAFWIMRNIPAHPFSLLAPPG